ncbi:amino acid ABC transporter ATP-binding protein, partial [Lactobacillus delbrueckii]
MEEKYKVQVTDLHKSYDGVHEVIKGASLDVAPSEVVCIIGPSGSGKSTFLRCINKLEDFQDGHIYLDGVDLADPKVDINKMREKIGMVFQHFNLFPNMTVLENITLAPVELGKEDKETAIKEAHKYLQMVNMDDKADVKPTTLSGGQQQRVAIAR